MRGEKSPSDEDVKESTMAPLIILGFLGGVVLLAVLLALGAYGKSYGEAGDFFGGFANPFLTFLTFMGVLITIRLQQRAIESARDEAKSANAVNTRQTFERTFFEMLSFHNSIVSALDIRKRGEQPLRVGRESFRTYYDVLKSEYDNLSSVRLAHTPEKAFNRAYQLFWDKYRQDLGHYYRFLFNMVRYIDESKLDNKITYVRLLRAQLSDYELALFLYNMHGPYGANFRKYAERYDLLDNLPRDLLFRPEHEEWIPAPFAAQPRDE